MPVYFNDAFLGTLDPNSTFTEFLIPENLIGLDNLVRVENHSLHDFVLEDKTFSIGAIDLIDVIPEPSTLLLLGTGLLGLAGWRRRFPS